MNEGTFEEQIHAARCLQLERGYLEWLTGDPDWSPVRPSRYRDARWLNYCSRAMRLIRTMPRPRYGLIPPGHETVYAESVHVPTKMWWRTYYHLALHGLPVPAFVRRRLPLPPRYVCVH